MFEVLSGNVKDPVDILTVARIQFEALCIPRRYRSEAFVYDDLQPWFDDPFLGMIVAYHGKEVVGSVFHCPFDKKKTREYGYHFHHAGLSLPDFLDNSREVSYITVAKEWVGQGAGSALLEQLIVDTSALRTSSLYAMLWSGGDFLPLFKQKGFRELARIPRLYHGTDDGIVVEKVL